MNETNNPEKEEWNRVNIKLAGACHHMSEVYEKMAGKPFEGTKLGELNSALEWENLSMEIRRQHSDVPENIKAGENNIQKIKEKIRKEGEKMYLDKLTKELQDVKDDICVSLKKIKEIENLEKRDFKTEKEKLLKQKEDLEIKEKEIMNAIRTETGGKPCD